MKFSRRRVLQGVTGGVVARCVADQMTANAALAAQPPSVVPVGQTSAHNAISNLVYRYAELVDDWDMDGVAELFRHARLKHDNEAPIDSRAFVERMRRSVTLHDGLPRVKHLITNPMIQFDEATWTASARSYYTVLQALPRFPLKIIMAGRHDDCFERVAGLWRFSFRHFPAVQMRGDLSQHLRA